jgi:hypothetical protein
MTIKWNKYTWYSKWAAIVFFLLVLPVWTFYLGMQFEKTREIVSQAVSVEKYTMIAGTPLPASYAYRCGDGSEFSLVPAKNFSSIRITPATSADIIPTATLKPLPAGSHTRFEGGGVSLFGNGTAVRITVGARPDVLSCQPIIAKGQAALEFR